VTFRKYLVLAGVALSASIGDSLLSRGMKQVGSISLNHLHDLILAVLNPSVALGILLLLGFFASYMTALSWADLTFVLPATSLGYVLLTLIARFYLHETVTTSRWIGILLISAGVGFVTRGPALTLHPSKAQPHNPEGEPASARNER
jgi:drug/metabolite transporter (DMT)-like permease